MLVIPAFILNLILMLVLFVANFPIGYFYATGQKKNAKRSINISAFAILTILYLLARDRYMLNDRYILEIDLLCLSLPIISFAIMKQFIDTFFDLLPRFYYVRAPNEGNDIEYDTSQPFSSHIELVALRKQLASGLIIEGIRRNIIGKDAEEKLAQRFGYEVCLSPEYAPDHKDMVVEVGAGEIARLEYVGKTEVMRADYTFSFYIYEEENNWDGVSLRQAIRSGSEVTSKHFNVADSTPTNNYKGMESYRAYVSHVFSFFPNEIVGKTTITNDSNSKRRFRILFPCIEEGRFPSHPIPCGEVRRGDGYSFKHTQNMRTMVKEGRIQFTFQTYWNGFDLTPGIDPYFMYWYSSDEKNGFAITGDSQNNGTLAILATKDGHSCKMVTDMVVLQNVIYLIDLSWDSNGVIVVVNNAHCYKCVDPIFPDCSKLDEPFYLGCKPENEVNAVFAIMTQLTMYNIKGFNVEGSIPQSTPKQPQSI